MKKKGFTLIELLAVIVILAIILLIAVPMVMNTIEDAERSSFESSIRKMSSTAEQRCLEEQVEKKAGGFETNFTESDFTGYDIDMKGDNPEGGTVRVNDQCQVEIAVHNAKTCVKKPAGSNEFTVTDYEDGNCELAPSELTIVSTNRFDVGGCFSDFAGFVSNAPTTVLVTLSDNSEIMLEVEWLEPLVSNFNDMYGNFVNLPTGTTNPLGIQAVSRVMAEC